MIASPLAPLEPEPVDPRERIAEIGEILALGLMRLRARQSSASCPEGGESPLVFGGDQSGDAPQFVERTPHE
jgi:hypothetical protein